MKHFAPSPTNLLHARASELKAKGIPVVNFAAGDPILENHPAILEEVFSELNKKTSPYAPLAGLPSLRKAAADWMNKRHHSHYEPENVLVTCGGKFALFAALKLLLEEGDEVLVPAPYWGSYPQIISLCGGHLKKIAASEKHDWKITAADLKKHLTSKSRIFLFNNPCNPTGALYSRQEVEELLAAAKEANLWVISDEVYSELVYDGLKLTSCSSFPAYQEKLIVVESCSKNFAMAGWRVGFAFAPEPIIEAMTAIQSQTTTGTSLLSQKAALGALLHADAVAAYVRKTLAARRKLFFDTYNRLFQTHHKAPPSGLYFLIKIGENSQKICEELLEKAHLALVPGSAFGMEGYARLIFSETEEDIVRGLTALKQYWDKPS